jgi:hypothetical protein
MTEYLLLWLSVLVFIGIGMLTNVLFFRSVHKKLGGHNSLDRMLFETNRKK